MIEGRMDESKEMVERQREGEEDAEKVIHIVRAPGELRIGQISSMQK